MVNTPEVYFRRVSNLKKKKKNGIAFAIRARLKLLKDKGYKGYCRSKMKKTFEVLNGFGIIDNLNVKEYNNMKITYESLCWKVIKSWNRLREITIVDQNLDEIVQIVDNDNFIQMSDKMEKFRIKYFNEDSLKQEFIYFNYEQDIADVFRKHWSEQELLDYLGIIPFTPSVMINISPDWKSAKEKMTNTTKAKRLESLVNDYLKIDQRYDYYSYVIENGATGEHIHAHIVAHINPKIGKSVNTHLAKSRHVPQLRTCAKRIKGMEGTIKGTGVVKTFLRNEQLVADKLDYLIEEKKPEGHKNKSVLTGRIDKVLFTVK